MYPGGAIVKLSVHTGKYMYWLLHPQDIYRIEAGVPRNLAPMEFCHPIVVVKFVAVSEMALLSRQVGKQ